jgi:3-hydroxyisobutyrate dehydrogenase
MKMQTVGFVGLGSMGAPLARRLALAGYGLRAHDAAPACRDRVPAGATWVDDAAGTGRGARAVLLSLPDGATVTDVVLGSGALVDALEPGAAVIDTSSSAPEGTRRLGAALAERGIELIDAPVSGGVVRAETGELTMMVGGDRDSVERWRPLLSVLASRIVHTGPLGSGHAMKALNNYVSAAGLLASLEALAAARSAGVDPEVALDVLNTSSGRNNSTENKIRPFVLSGSFDSGFSLRLMAKDLGIAAGVAESARTPAELLQACMALWDRSAAALDGASDHTMVGLGLGLDLRGDGT